ncbi:response regulator [Vibrio sp. JPW-9-11-11]|uniref:hybrid sensor histidine kinase/response regulator n=1 Tax=Vibrio sp. JPW-9-11-11 TaxID=1416532 RepID=UPI001594C604|nr:response regulator [Vibrio sp. JPW-9-11-11]NVD08038.1 response regulator [Vibrio sp. JPW-9-11-11]
MDAILDSIRKVYQYAEPNLTLVGWMGLIGFPTYYYIWSDLFPQPYENLTLRLACSLLFAGIALRHYLPKYLQQYLAEYYFISIGICLPFFFSFMMFMNEWSTIWAMSFMASIFLHVLLVHQTRLMLLQALVAVVLAYLSVYGFDIAIIQQQVVWPYIPIFLFTYVFGNLFYFRNQAEHESKVSLAKSFGAGIAHEMRNPLSALKSSLDVVESLLPKSGAGGSSQYKLTEEEVAMAREVLSDAHEVIRTGNETIDLLLTSIDENRVSRTTFKKHSIRKVVKDSLQSFAYKSSKDRQAVTLLPGDDFEFFGSDALIKYALYNLLKNAFYYQNANQFAITVELRSFERHNELIFTDNGVGIEPEVINDVFKDFYTFGKTGSYGLGLPFCRKVMMALGGQIACRSTLGEWTEFTLSFPKYGSQEISVIKSDIMKSKSVLYVGGQSKPFRLINEEAFYRGFNLRQLSLDAARDKQEYEFEYDLIVIDLDEAVANPDALHELESKLHFTEGRIVFLFNEQNRYHNDVERHLTIYPVEVHNFLLKSRAILDELLFETPSANRNLLPRKQTVAGKTILLADDNQSLRTYTSILLEQQGFHVLQAENGQEAVEKVAQNSVDLIIMDLEMPKVDGLAATVQIRHSASENSEIPILAHTGDSSDSMLEKIQQAGMNDYIVKPADTHLLLDKIANWI